MNALAEVREVHLKPGQLFIGREPHLVSTLLGSCLAVTMLHRRSGLAAICHAMLPNPGSSKYTDTPPPERPKYVSCVIHMMVESFEREGVRPTEIEVKMFGGGDVLTRQDGAMSTLSVGSANIRSARQCLRQHQLHIKASNVGGTRGRKILFNTTTGEVLHRFLAEPTKRRSVARWPQQNRSRCW